MNFEDNPREGKAIFITGAEQHQTSSSLSCRRVGVEGSLINVFLATVSRMNLNAMNFDFDCHFGVLPASNSCLVLCIVRAVNSLHAFAFLWQDQWRRRRNNSSN